MNLRSDDRFGRWWLVAAGAALLAMLAAGTFYPLYDAALFEYFGRAIVHGQRLYADEWDNKLPSIYFVNAAWQLLFGDAFRLHEVAETLIYAVGSTALFAGIVRRWRVAQWELAVLAFSVTAVLAAYALNEGADAAESYATPLLLGAILAASYGRGAVAGICAALAATFWIPSVLALAPVAFALPATRERIVAAIGFGATLAVYLAVAVVAIRVDFGELSATWLRYVSRDNAVASVGTRTSLAGTVRDAASSILRSGIATWLAVLALSLRRPGSRDERFALVWLASSLAGAFATGRFYEHYFLPSMAPAVFAAFVFFERGRVRGLRYVFAVLAAVFIVQGAVSTIHHVAAMRAEAADALRVGAAIDAAVGTNAVIEVDQYRPQIFLASNALPVDRGSIAHLGYVRSGAGVSRVPALFVTKNGAASPERPAGFARLCPGRSLDGWQFFGRSAAAREKLCALLSSEFF